MLVLKQLVNLVAFLFEDFQLIFESSLALIKNILNIIKIYF